MNSLLRTLSSPATRFQMTFVSSQCYIWHVTGDFCPSIPLCGDIIHAGISVGQLVPWAKMQSHIPLSCLHLSSSQHSPCLSDDRYAAWQPWPGKVHIWHWTCHSAFILPTPPSPRQGITLSLSRYRHSFFSHLNMNCFIAGIVGIVVTRWPVKPCRWYEKYWSQLNAKESVSSDILSWMQIWDRWIDGQSGAQAGSL